MVIDHTQRLAEIRRETREIVSRVDTAIIEARLQVQRVDDLLERIEAVRAVRSSWTRDDAMPRKESLAEAGLLESVSYALSGCLSYK
jgi:hypothetical protein